MILHQNAFFLATVSVEILMFLLFETAFMICLNESPSSAQLSCTANDPFEMIPVDQIWNDILVAYEYDSEARAAFDYLITEEFQQKLQKLKQTSEFSDFIEKCKVMNLGVPDAMDNVKTFLRDLVEQIKASNKTQLRLINVDQDEISNGIHGLIMRIVLKRLSFTTIGEYVQKQQVCNADFNDKIKHLQSPEFKDAILKVLQLKEYKDLTKALKDHNVLFKVYLRFLFRILGVDMRRNSHDNKKDKNVQLVAI